MPLGNHARVRTVGTSFDPRRTSRTRLSEDIGQSSIDLPVAGGRQHPAVPVERPDVESKPTNQAGKLFFTFAFGRERPLSVAALAGQQDNTQPKRSMDREAPSTK